MKRNVVTLALTLALAFTGAAWASAADPDANGAGPETGNTGSVVLFALPGTGELRVTALRPVQLPGAVLQPGEYSLRLNESSSVVTVTNVEGSEFYGSYLIIPASRNHRSDTVAYTAAAPAGGPDRLLSVFRPGSLWGYAFVYPKAANVQVASR